MRRDSLTAVTMAVRIVGASAHLAIISVVIIIAVVVVMVDVVLVGNHTHCCCHKFLLQLSSRRTGADAGPAAPRRNASLRLRDLLGERSFQRLPRRVLPSGSLR